ncbi:DUF4384 domain-containing protein [Deinococcus maricopensis]|uniref:S-layer-like protein array-related protein n=1 Tax=Deinococcus maricopensis (strain DSM 21211 / LMG 22137 / NRRL B-23946 / LB-34) TaxID=709986 RepID=E8U679_DEIML|nr:DUF4384 domain-containing protein [Deinococcus maricopensis]ADV66568.1 S-layer-like protein array-related protein [Deinococcus maricopensis DSM 21211]
MKQLLILSALLAGVASAGPSKISAQSIIVNPTEPPLSVQVRVNRDPSGQGNPKYRIGEGLTVTVKTNSDAYVYLFDVNADGRITLISPNNYDGSNFVQAGQATSFPGPKAQYQFNVSGPAGQDKVLALASTEKLNLGDLARFEDDAAFATVSARGQDELAQALSIVVNPVPQDAWVTDTAYFTVVGAAQAPAPQPQPQPQPQPKPQPQPGTPVAAIQPGEREDGSTDAAIAAAYDRLRGGESLGTATTYVQRWGNGAWQKFRGVGAYGNGVLLHADGSSRAYAVHGAILKRYLALAQAESGAARPPSRLGWAAGDEKVIPRNRFGTSGLYGFFQSGALYSTEKYGTFWLTGALLKTYQGLGGSGSVLGFPKRDQYLLNGAWAADFEGGTIRYVSGQYRVYRK